MDALVGDPRTAAHKVDLRTGPIPPSPYHKIDDSIQMNASGLMYAAVFENAYKWSRRLSPQDRPDRAI
jgi:hypothetical protein